MRHPVLRAGALLALVDFLWAWVLAWAYGSTVIRTFQGVASVPFGPSMTQAGMRGFWIGIALHVCVAFTWAAIFYFVVMKLPAVMLVLRSNFGIVKAAAVYGPFIWIFMSWVVIPAFLHRPPTITYRWWIQLAGHIPFVGLPVVWGVCSARSSGAPALVEPT